MINLVTLRQVTLGVMKENREKIFFFSKQAKKDKMKVEMRCLAFLSSVLSLLMDAY